MPSVLQRTLRLLVPCQTTMNIVVCFVPDVRTYNDINAYLMIVNFPCKKWFVNRPCVLFQQYKYAGCMLKDRLRTDDLVVVIPAVCVYLVFREALLSYPESPRQQRLASHRAGVPAPHTKYSYKESVPYKKFAQTLLVRWPKLFRSRKRTRQKMYEAAQRDQNKKDVRLKSSLLGPNPAFGIRKVG